MLVGRAYTIRDDLSAKTDQVILGGRAYTIMEDLSAKTDQVMLGAGGHMP